METGRLTRNTGMTEARRGWGTLLSSCGLLAARVAGTVATLVATLVLARLLSPQEFGAFWTIWSCVIVLASLASLNLPAVAIKEVVKAIADDRPDRVAGFVVFCRRVLVALTIPFALVFAAFLLWRAPDLLRAYPLGCLCAALAIPLLGYSQLLGAYGVALRQPIRAQAPRDLIRPALFALVLTSAALGSWTVSLGLVLGLCLLCEMAVLASQVALLPRARGIGRIASPNMTGALDWVASGLLLGPTKILADRMKSVLILSASAVLSGPDVAILAVALSLVGVLGFSAVAVETSVSAKVARALHSRNFQRAEHHLAVAGALRAGFFTVGALVFLWLAPWILAAFGTSFGAAGAVLYALIVIPAARALFGRPELALQILGLRSVIFQVALATLTALVAAPLVMAWALGRVDVDMVAWAFAAIFAASRCAIWGLCLLKTGVDCSAPGALRRVLTESFPIRSKSRRAL